MATRSCPPPGVPSEAGAETSIPPVTEGGTGGGGGGGAGGQVAAGGEGGTDAGTGGRPPEAGAPLDATSPCGPHRASCGAASDGGCETDLDTNADHCGACGHACLGGECNGGQCQPVTLAENQNGPTDLAVNSTDVYWFDADGSIFSVPRAGGPVRTLATGEAVVDIAVDDAFVYWARSGATVAGPAPGMIRRLPVTEADAGTPETVYTGVNDGTVLENVGVLTRDADSLYFHVYDQNTAPLGQQYGASAYMKLPLAGGPATRVHPATGYATLQSAWVSMNVQGQSLFVAGGIGEVATGGWLLKMGISDGTFTKLFQSPAEIPIAVAASADHAYFSVGYTSDGGALATKLYSVRPGGGSPSQIADSGYYGTAVDGTHVYFDTLDNTVRRATLAGASPEVLLRGRDFREIVLTDDALYVALADAPGAIWKLAK